MNDSRTKLTFYCLQEDKEPLFDSVETVVAMLEVSAEFALILHLIKREFQSHSLEVIWMPQPWRIILYTRCMDVSLV